MSITLEEIENTQQKLSEMIAQFKASVPTKYVIPEMVIELAQGERYVATRLEGESNKPYHLILLPGEAEDVTWHEAQKFAKEAGGELPSCADQHLLFANVKGEFKPNWYWSGEQYSEDDAWVQGFSNGGSGSADKTIKGRARAVRLVPL